MYVYMLYKCIVFGPNMINVILFVPSQCDTPLTSHLLYPHNVLPSYVHPPSERTAESGLSHSATGFLLLEAISPNFCHLSRWQKQQHLVETFGTNLISPGFSRVRIFTRLLLQKWSSLQEEILSVCLSVCLSVRHHCFLLRIFNNLML